MGPGKLFYIGGIDGAGKTTQAEAFVRAAVARDGRWTYRWARWEPRVTAPLMSLARRALPRGDAAGAARPQDDAGYAQFRRGKQRVFRTRFARGAWTTIVLLEYLPQVCWRLLPSLWRGRRVVCDRYLPDVWVDLAMNFGVGADGLARLQHHPLCRFFPLPVGGAILDLDAAEGHRRKNDGTPLAYLADRRPLYLAVARLLGLAIVDASAPPGEVAARVAAALLGASGDGSARGS